MRPGRHAAWQREHHRGRTRAVHPTEGIVIYTVKNLRDVRDDDEADEVYVILSGSGRIKLDDDIVEVGPMDAIRVAPIVTRALEGGPEGIEYLAVGRHHHGDGAVLPIEEFWQ